MNNTNYSEMKNLVKEIRKYEQAKNTPQQNPIKLILITTACIASLIFLYFISKSFYENNFSIEVLLSIALAFFSIFISIFFYFKAEKTSNDFYKASYDFMKEMAVSLGKVDTRFTEKFDRINEKLSKIDTEMKEKSTELKQAEDEKSRYILKVIDNPAENDEVKQQYKQELKEKDEQIKKLKKELKSMETQRDYITYPSSNFNIELDSPFSSKLSIPITLDNIPTTNPISNDLLKGIGNISDFHIDLNK